MKFNIPGNNLGTATSDLTVYSLPFSIISTFFISFVFEILGRRLSLFLSFVSTALLYAILPYTAGHYYWLVAVRCMIGVTMSAPLAHPLVADYIHKNSRGKAIALCGMGFVFGELLAMGVLFNLTKDMSIQSAFLIVATCIGCYSGFILLTIKDPDLKSLRKAFDNQINPDYKVGGI